MLMLEVKCLNENEVCIEHLINKKFSLSIKGRRSLDRAISSSSTHRSNRHRRHSQHQQQSPAPQSSVSYVANKVSFSLVNESNPPLLPTVNKQNEDDYELITTGDDDGHYHPQPQHQHIIPREPTADDEEEEEEEEEEEAVQEEENNNNEEEEEEDPVVVEQLREQATVMVSNILASAFDQINILPKDSE